MRQLARLVLPVLVLDVRLVAGAQERAPVGVPAALVLQLAVLPIQGVTTMVSRIFSRIVSPIVTGLLLDKPIQDAREPSGAGAGRGGVDDGSAGARSWSCVGVGRAPRLPTGTAPAPGSVTYRLAPPSVAGHERSAAGSPPPPGPPGRSSAR
ncbi:hypothetical protein PtA15_2A51 [Puccinia triticina]|uniref:Secreted protein n=1 Tax=Puccinia triticina TaxID=208348 RepID=A0ABY7CD02_9BASI|nr:uncharacterized protein PtA15_2A51 [Puccinia triticina]WAQ81740.1 hypothetical protein PtA15_2A51 [Puccinia triticina]WAR52626.1 hypothetical protein PtB15_2B50 [Puccinia triticina]